MFFGCSVYSYLLCAVPGDDCFLLNNQTLVLYSAITVQLVFIMPLAIALHVIKRKAL